MKLGWLLLFFLLGLFGMFTWDYYLGTPGEPDRSDDAEPHDHHPPTRDDYL